MTSKPTRKPRVRRVRESGSAMTPGAAVLEKPQPLISREHRLVALWTPKVGCTSFVKWFFKSAETSFGPRNMPVHQFRQHVYYPSTRYQEALADYELNHREYHHIKIIRHPYKRTVSSFIQLLKMEEVNSAAFKKFLGVTDMPSNFELSFAEFVARLAEKNIANCNQHWKRQFHALEENLDLRFRYAEIAELSTFLAGIEEDLDLPRSPRKFLRASKNQAHHTKRSTQPSGFVGEKRYNGDSTASMPEFHHFYNADLLESVRSIYRKDFHFYRFDPRLEMSERRPVPEKVRAKASDPRSERPASS